MFWVRSALVPMNWAVSTSCPPRSLVRRVELTHKGIPVEIVLLDPPAISRNRQEAAQMEETPQETTDQALEELLHSLEGAPWEQWDQLPPAQ